MKQIGSLLVAVAVLGWPGGDAAAAPAKAVAKAKGEVFIIQTEHYPRECLATMDAVAGVATGVKKGKAQKAAGLLDKTWWGCTNDDHRAWIVVTAKDKDAALTQIPEAMRSGAKVARISKVTPKLIKEMKKKRDGVGN